MDLERSKEEEESKKTGVTVFLPSVLTYGFLSPFFPLLLFAPSSRISVLTTALAVATYASVFVPLRALLPDARTAFVVFGVTVHEVWI